MLAVASQVQGSLQEQKPLVEQQAEVEEQEQQAEVEEQLLLQVVALGLASPHASSSSHPHAWCNMDCLELLGGCSA